MIPPELVIAGVAIFTIPAAVAALDRFEPAILIHLKLEWVDGLARGRILLVAFPHLWRSRGFRFRDSTLEDVNTRAFTIKREIRR